MQGCIIKADPSALEISSHPLHRGREQHKSSRDGFPLLSLLSTQAPSPLQEASFSSAHRQISKRTNDVNGPAFISKDEKNSYLFLGLQFSPHAAEDRNKRAQNERD